MEALRCVCVLVWFCAQVHAFPVNITAAYLGEWDTKVDKRQPLKNSTHGRLEISLLSIPSLANTSAPKHYFTGEIIVRGKTPLYLQSVHGTEGFKIRGEYDQRTGKAIGLALPMILNSWLNPNTTHLNRSAVMQSFAKTKAQIELFLAPETQETRRAIQSKPYFTQGLADPALRSLRSVLRSHHAIDEVCVGLVEMSFDIDHHLLPALPAVTAQDIELHPKVLSATFTSSCSWVMTMNATTQAVEDLHSRATTYAIATTVMTLLQIQSLITQMSYTNTQSGISRVSFLTISHLSYSDIFLFCIHLLFPMLLGCCFKAFMTAAFLEFCLCSCYELRYTQNVFRGQYPEESSRRPNLLIKLGIVLMFGLGVLSMQSLLWIGGWVVFPVLSFWTYQIVWNVKRSFGRPLQLQYIATTTLTRGFGVLYFFGYSGNFLEVPVDPVKIIVLEGYLAAQTIILLCQYKYGPWCIVPKSLQPVKFDYHQPYKKLRDLESQEEEEVECVICQDTVDVDCPASYMLPPCQHIFHQGCLLEWSNQKMECPTCRGPLPDM